MLTWFNVFYAVLPLLALVLIMHFIGLGMTRQFLLAITRSHIQLFILANILNYLFFINQWWVLTLAFLFMLIVASWTVLKRLKVQNRWYFCKVITTSLLLPGSTLSLYLIILCVPSDPWYDVSVSIPLLGMLLGNGLTGVTLGLERFIKDIQQQKLAIEFDLALGASEFEACKDIMAQSIRSGTTPIINSMMVVGLVSIPGMMTGQLLGGGSPILAGQYQMIILSLICACSLCAILIGVGLLFLDYRRGGSNLF